jgi:hypothetical protein
MDRTWSEQVSHFSFREPATGSELLATCFTIETSSMGSKLLVPDKLRKVATSTSVLRAKINRLKPLSEFGRDVARTISSVANAGWDGPGFGQNGGAGEKSRARVDGEDGERRANRQRWNRPLCGCGRLHVVHSVHSIHSVHRDHSDNGAVSPFPVANDRWIVCTNGVNSANGVNER